MNNDTEYPNGCCEEFAELCALSTSGELSAEELVVLDEHIARCAPCAALLQEYTSLATVGMAKLAANRDQEIETPIGYNSARAEERFIDAFRSAQPTWRSKLRSSIRLLPAYGHGRSVTRTALLIGTAAVLLICAGAAFELGRKMTPAASRTEARVIVQPAGATDAEKIRLKDELAAAQASLETITEKSAEAERQLDELSGTKTSLLAQINELTQKDGADSASLTSVTEQRDSLQQQLSDTSNLLTRARDDLNRAQQDRQGALFRVTTLETEVNDLHTELSTLATLPRATRNTWLRIVTSAS